MKVCLILSALLLAIVGCNANGKENKGKGILRDQVKKEWEQYVEDFRNDEDDDEDDLGLEDLEKEVEGNGPAEMNGCPSGDEVDELTATCQFTIANTMAPTQMMATIKFSDDVFGIRMPSGYQLYLPKGQRGRAGRRRGPRAAKIYRITNLNELSAGSTITVDMKIFANNGVAPTHTCILETCNIV